MKIDAVILGYTLIALLVSVSSLSDSPKYLLSRDGTYLYSLGGYGGNQFQFTSNSNSSVRYVRIRHGLYIDSIQLCFSNGECSPVQGGNGGVEAVWEVPQGEQISQIEYRTGALVDSLRFITNKGNKSQTFGGNGGSPYSISIPDRNRIVGFYGHSGTSLHRLGFILSSTY